MRYSTEDKVSGLLVVSSCWLLIIASFTSSRSNRSCSRLKRLVEASLVEEALKIAAPDGSIPQKITVISWSLLVIVVFEILKIWINNPLSE